MDAISEGSVLDTYFCIEELSAVSGSLVPVGVAVFDEPSKSGGVVRR